MMDPMTKRIHYTRLQVESTTLPSLLHLYPEVTVLKVDIQGAERDVLLDVADWGNIRMVVVEYDFEYNSRSIADYDAFVKHMCEYFPVNNSRRNLRQDEKGNFVGFPTGIVLRMKKKGTAE